MGQKNEENGGFRHFLPSFCVEISKISSFLLLFLLFFFLCPRFFVILARISRMRVHYIFAQIVFRISTSQNEFNEQKLIPVWSRV